MSGGRSIPRAMGELGAAPHGIDLLKFSGALQIEPKFTFSSTGIPRSVLTRAADQSFRYTATYQQLTGLVPIRMVKIYNPVLGVARLGR
jgi:hypothetical protein